VRERAGERGDGDYTASVEGAEDISKACTFQWGGGGGVQEIVKNQIPAKGKIGSRGGESRIKGSCIKKKIDLRWRSRASVERGN